MQIDQAQLLKDITSFLNKNKIPYMITGAWSVIYYARPRASHDIDFVVELHKEDIKRIIKAFKTLNLEYLVQFDQIQQAIEDKSMFNIIHLSTFLKLDFWLLKDDDFNKTRFARRKNVKILDQYMCIATPEDTVLKKLLWYKEAKIEKHLIDAAFVYQVQKNNLDRFYLRKWATKLKINKLYNQLVKIDLEKYI